MRILHIIGSADPRFGGPIEGILQQERAFGGAATSELVTLDADDAAFLKDFPLPVRALGSGSIGLREKSPVVRYGFSWKYIRWIRDNAHLYDVVIVHGLWNFSAMAASIVLPLMKSREYFVYPHGMLDPWFAKSDPRKHFFKRLSWLMFEGRLLSRARAVLFTAGAEEDLAGGQFWGWKYNPVVIGYGTAEPPEFSVEQEQAFSKKVSGLSERKYILFLSRIHPKKGCDMLISSFAKIADERPDLDLVIAGPDECGLLPELKAQAESLGIGDRIHWPGMLVGDAKWGAYRGAEAFILPSHQENFGIVVAEALACGVPVLTTNKVNIGDVVEAGRGGFIGDDTIEGVDGVLRRWFDLPREGRRKMSRAAEALFREKFSVEFVAGKFLALVERADSPSVAERPSVKALQPGANEGKAA
jgi:glycosyltransferase involved in cell wall biosynthesis